jgi:hypothetical protein
LLPEARALGEQRCAKQNHGGKDEDRLLHGNIFSLPEGQHARAVEGQQAVS